MHDAVSNGCDRPPARPPTSTPRIEISPRALELEPTSVAKRPGKATANARTTTRKPTPATRPAAPAPMNDMKLANITLEEMTEALNRGWAERGSRVAMLLQEERAGVQIKVTEEAIREALAVDKTPPR